MSVTERSAKQTGADVASPRMTFSLFLSQQQSILPFPEEASIIFMKNIFIKYIYKIHLYTKWFLPLYSIVDNSSIVYYVCVYIIYKSIKDVYFL